MNEETLEGEDEVWKHMSIYLRLQTDNNWAAVRETDVQQMPEESLAQRLYTYSERTKKNTKSQKLDFLKRTIPTFIQITT